MLLIMTRILHNMYRLKLYCSLLLLSSLFACKQPHGELLQALRTVDGHLLPTGHYVIIPNQGCEGCISTAEDFVKRHYTSAQDVKYIFTRAQSLKLLRIKLGNEVMSSSKVLVDSGNVIRYPEKEKGIGGIPEWAGWVLLLILLLAAPACTASLAPVKLGLAAGG